MESFKNGQDPSAKYPDSFVNWQISVTYLPLMQPIESARAGEHGRGFAVVANEIRRLATQTKQSAEDISKLIQSIMDSVKQTVDFVSLRS